MQYHCQSDFINPNYLHKNFKAVENSWNIYNPNVMHVKGEASEVKYWTGYMSCFFFLSEIIERKWKITLPNDSSWSSETDSYFMKIGTFG